MVRSQARSRDGRRLEDLDEVAGRVDGEHLGATGAAHDLVAELHAFLLEPGDLALDVVHDEVDAVPTAGPRLLPVGHRSAGRALRPGQQQPQVATTDLGEGGDGEADREAE